MSSKKQATGQHIAESDSTKQVTMFRSAVFILAAAVLVLAGIIIFLIARNSHKSEPEPEAAPVISETTPVPTPVETAVTEQEKTEEITSAPQETPVAETSEPVVSGPPVPLTDAAQLTDEALEQMKAKTLECIDNEEAGWYEGNSIESVDYLGRVILARIDETAPNDNVCTIVYRINMKSQSGSSVVSFSYYYPVQFYDLQVYPDGHCEADLDNCRKPHFFHAIGLLFYGVETYEDLERDYIVQRSYGWKMDSDISR